MQKEDYYLIGFWGKGEISGGCLMNVGSVGGNKNVLWASLVAQLVKKLHAMHETWIQSLSWEDPLEKGTE